VFVCGVCLCFGLVCVCVVCVFVCVVCVFSVWCVCVCSVLCVCGVYVCVVEVCPNFPKVQKAPQNL